MTPLRRLVIQPSRRLGHFCLVLLALVAPSHLLAQAPAPEGNPIFLYQSSEMLWDTLQASLPANLATADRARFGAAFQEWLTLREQEPLLRLSTADEIAARLTFHNSGPNQVPGVIVMQLRNDVGPRPSVSPGVDRLLVVFNASVRRVFVSVPEAAGRGWVVHPVQAGGVDAATVGTAFVTTASGTVSAPPLSVVVFVAPDTVHLPMVGWTGADSQRPGMVHRMLTAEPLDMRQDFESEEGLPFAPRRQWPP